MSKIEEVAKALANHVHQGGDYGMTGEDAFAERRDDYLAMARAAIEAMRDLSPELKSAGAEAFFSRMPTTIEEENERAASVYRRVIEAALSEEVAR